MFTPDHMSTVWSAAPTPMLADGTLDTDSIRRLADHHERLGVRGVFIGGTCGEGPYLPRTMLYDLARETVAASHGRQAVALQITDNSAARMIENLRRYTDTGIDLAVVAPPFCCIHADQEYLYEMYAEVIEQSPVPVGLYHQGRNAAVAVTGETIARLARLPKVVTLKNSTSSPEDARQILAARDERRQTSRFYAYHGNEFDCVGAALAGFDGMMIGGACFNARLAARVFQLARDGQVDEACALQKRLNALMYDAFGGRDIQCWLAGEKQLMVELGVFTTNRCITNYRLTPECAAALKGALNRERDWLV